MKFFEKKPNAGEFTTLFANVALTGTVHLNTATKAAFSNMSLDGKITADGNIQESKAETTTVFVENSALTLTAIVDVNKLVLGENAIVRIDSETGARLRFDEVTITGGNAALILDNGTLVVQCLTVAKGGMLKASNIESPTMKLEPGARIFGHVSSEINEPATSTHSTTAE